PRRVTATGESDSRKLAMRSRNSRTPTLMVVIAVSLRTHKCTHADKYTQGCLCTEAREHTVLVQAHCPSRFRYNPNSCRSLSAKAETHLPGKHVLRLIPNAQTFETRRTGTMRRKIDRQATDEDGGRRDENRRACFIFLSITS